MNTDQSLNAALICRFLTSRSAISIFLVLGLLLAVVIVVFLQPVGLLGNTTQTSSISPLSQVALMTVAGYLTVVFSRWILYAVSRHKELSLSSLTIWLSVELLLCVSAAVFTLWLVSGGGPLRLGPLAGDILLGNIGIFLVPNIISFQEFRIHELKSKLRQSAVLQQTFQPTTHLPDQHINFYEKGGRLALTTRCSNVLYIEAADNYANIHYIIDGKEDTFILHNSLKDIEKDCLAMGLLRCHRGYMVNVDNVKLMRKERGNLLLELKQTTRTIPVSKSYSSSVIRYFSTNNPSAPLSGPIPVL